MNPTPDYQKDKLPAPSTSTLEKVRPHVFSKEQIYCYKIIDSPMGALHLVASPTALVALTWGSPTELIEISRKLASSESQQIITLAELQLSEYFKGKRKVFDIPLAPRGTEFQKSVWEQLLRIPHGQVITYGEQAQRLGRPTASRAVGAANGKNPISIIVPCHRVIAASGNLTGYAGGLETKRKLLMIEGVVNWWAL